MTFSDRVDAYETKVKEICEWAAKFAVDNKDAAKRAKNIVSISIREWETLQASFDAGLSDRITKVAKASGTARKAVAQEALKTTLDYTGKCQAFMESCDEAGDLDDVATAVGTGLMPILAEIKKDLNGVLKDPADEQAVTRAKDQVKLWSKKKSSVVKYLKLAFEQGTKEGGIDLVIASMAKDCAQLKKLVPGAAIFRKLDTAGDKRYDLAVKLQKPAKELARATNEVVQDSEIADQSHAGRNHATMQELLEIASALNRAVVTIVTDPIGQRMAKDMIATASVGKR